MIIFKIFIVLWGLSFVVLLISIFDDADDDLPHNIYIGSGARMKEYWDRKWKEPMKEIRIEWIDEKGQKCFSSKFYR